MGISRTGGILLGAGVLLSMGSAATASMGNAPSTYGILPHDVATAQALSLFNNQASATYYNPAALARDSRGELTGGIFHAEHDLKATSLGGPDPADRSGSTINSTPSQQLQLGLKTDLSQMTTFRHPLYLGFMLGAEKFSQELLALSADSTETGQFLEYGRQPLFISVGVGTKLWRGINFGAAMRVTLHSDADLYMVTDFEGTTERERVSVSAEPVLRPIFGFDINMGETFCATQNCWMDNLDVAIGYRGYSNTQVRINAEAEMDDTISDPGLLFAIKAIDSFQPEITTLGVQYEFGGHTRVGVTGEYQAWQRLSREFEGDTVRDQGNVKFHDIVIPRVGVEHDVTDNFSVKAGAAWEETPLGSRRNPGVNYLANDRMVFGLGLSATANNLPFMAFPVQFDFGYQAHVLKSRTWDLADSDGNDLETVRSSGNVHVFAGSVTLKF